MRFEKLILVLAVSAANFLQASVLAADDKPAPRTITVSGTAEMRVVPDEVTLWFGIKSFSPNLGESKRQSDEKIKRVLAVAASSQIGADNIQTGQISVNIRYEDRDGRIQYDKISGYEVYKGVTIRLNDLTKFEGLLSALIDAGVNDFDGIDFRSSEFPRHREAARTDALTVAREKATKMAGVLGEKIGRPLSIQEESSSSRSYNRYANLTSNSVQMSGNVGVADTGETTAAGRIAIAATVSVTFELQ